MRFRTLLPNVKTNFREIDCKRRKTAKNVFGEFWFPWYSCFTVTFVINFTHYLSSRDPRPKIRGRNIFEICKNWVHFFCVFFLGYFSGVFDTWRVHDTPILFKIQKTRFEKVIWAAMPVKNIFKFADFLNPLHGFLFFSFEISLFFKCLYYALVYACP